MKLGVNQFTKNIRTGEKQVGLWVGLADNFSADIIAGTGFDWVVIDMEHSHNTEKSVLAQMQVFEGTSTTALVRPEWNDPVRVKRLLDMGAKGFVFPMIQSVAEAELAVSSTRYPPRGIRGVSGVTRATNFGRISDYTTRVEDETTVIVQLETRAAIEQAVEIGSVEGVTGVFFGPADIAADLGYLGQPMHDEVWKVILPAAQKLMALGIPVGTLVMDQLFAAKLLKDGFTFVAGGTDSGLLARAADTALATIKDNMN